MILPVKLSFQLVQILIFSISIFDSVGKLLASDIKTPCAFRGSCEVWTSPSGDKCGLTLSLDPNLFAGNVYIAQDGHERFGAGIAIAEDGRSDGSISDSVPKESSKAISERVDGFGSSLGEHNRNPNPSRQGLHLGPNK